MESSGDRALAILLLACSLLAVLLAAAFAWALRNASLAGFFLAVGIASAAFALLFWPDPPRR